MAQQEDEELRQLLLEEQRLREQLTGSTSQAAKKGKTSVSDSHGNGATQGEANILSTLQNLTGVTFDMLGFLDDNRPKQGNVGSLNVVETPKKVGKSKAKKTKMTPEKEESEVDMDVSESGDESTDEEMDRESVRRKDARKGNVRSGHYDRMSDTKLISNEWYAHTALDETMGGDRQFNDLSFNLLVAGELEIISSRKISEKEKSSRIELLKILAYRHQVIPLNEVLTQYAGFLSKIEKGKYKWGSKRDLSTFKQQLVYSVSMDMSRVSSVNTSAGQGGAKDSKEEKKKYCWEYNRSSCNLSSPHEGWLGNVKVMKYHLCKKCLMDKGLERVHPSKECGKN